MARLTRQDITPGGAPPLLLGHPSLHPPLRPTAPLPRLSVLIPLQAGVGAPEDHVVSHSPNCTDHQGVNGGGGLQPAQLHTELVVTRVSTLGLSDEEDGVPAPHSTCSHDWRPRRSRHACRWLEVGVCPEKWGEGCELPREASCPSQLQQGSDPLGPRGDLTRSCKFLE